MRILITGGTGFIGKQLAQRLLDLNTLTLEGQAPRAIERIVLFDAFAGEDVPNDPRIVLVTGEVADPDVIARVTDGVDLVWHLAAVVSSAAEADFDLGMQVNLHGLMLLLETLRKQGNAPRFVYASGFAVFGGAVLDFEDFLVSNLFLPLGSLVYLLFCVSRYGWGWDNYKKEVNTGEGLKIHDWMRGYLTYGLPVIVLFIFAFGIYDKFFA